jgi:hypothetical protein
MARRIIFLLTLSTLIAVAIFAFGPRADSPAYFQFADQRRFLGIPHFMDVISNAPWALIGIAGLLFVRRTRCSPLGPFTETWERAASAVLFAAIAAVSCGSAYFHLAPSAETLVWDRLPMAVVFMSLFALVIDDRTGLRVGRLLFPPLVALGIASVLWWRHTLAAGAPDLRLYVLVQYLPLAVIPMLLLLSPGRYTHARLLWLAFGSYALAKLFELADTPIFAATRFISGHTLKHLMAAVASLFLLELIRTRRSRESQCCDEPGNGKTQAGLIQ